MKNTNSIDMERKIVQVSQLSVEDFLEMVAQRVNQVILSNRQAQNIIPEPEFYTREETAKLLQVSVTTLYHWNKSGILNHTKIGNRVYYARSEVFFKLKAAS